MKKLVTVFVSILVLFAICGCSGEREIKKNETLLEYYEESEEYFDYDSTFFDFRLPLYWKGKYVVDVYLDHEDFYEKSSFDENGTGLVFSIYAYDDKSYRKDFDNYRYLDYHDDLKKHYILVYPDKEEYIESAKEVYNNLKDSISVVLYTFDA